MALKSSLRVVFPVFYLSFCAAVLATNVLPNGDFEQPGFGTPPFFRYLQDGDSTTISGWTISNDGVGEAPYYLNRAAYPSLVHRGNYGVALNQGAGLHATFPTVSNVTYQLSVWINPSTDPLNQIFEPLAVHVAGFTTNFVAEPRDVFSRQTFQFVAPSTDSSAVLELLNNASPGDYKIYAVDDVAIEPVILFNDSQLNGDQFTATITGVRAGQTIILQTSSNLLNWDSIQTNLASGATLNITNFVDPQLPSLFLRAFVQ